MFGLNDNDDHKNDQQQNTDNTSVPSVPDVTKPADNTISGTDSGFTATAPPPPPTPDNNDVKDTKNDDLLDIKQKALEQLQPLVDHLDQTPEEKFKTTMMMIQASDNKALLPTAYQAAQGIGDEKTRAEALLGIINEINYFTQKS
jgi:hypothetical protein